MSHCCHSTINEGESIWKNHLLGKTAVVCNSLNNEYRPSEAQKCCEKQRKGWRGKKKSGKPKAIEERSKAADRLGLSFSNFCT